MIGIISGDNHKAFYDERESSQKTNKIRDEIGVKDGRFKRKKLQVEKRKISKHRFIISQ